MEFEEFKHKHVAANGNIEKEGGAVETKGGLRIGIGKGCGLENCHCSDGYYISVVMPRDKIKKEVRGIKIKFKDGKEMEKTIREAY